MRDTRYSWHISIARSPEIPTSHYGRGTGEQLVASLRGLAENFAQLPGEVAFDWAHIARGYFPVEPKEYLEPWEKA